VLFAMVFGLSDSIEVKNLQRAFLIGFVILLLQCSPSALAGSQYSDQGVKEGEFRAPKVGLAPFWFWNGDMRPDEMERQLRAMKEVGINSVVFHPRSGLGGDFGHGEMEYYLSETYFDRFKSALEICRRLGLKVILYDEYNWPSGQAGGRVLKGGLVGSRQVPPNPEYIAKHLAMVEVNVGTGSQGESPWTVPEGKLVGVIAAQSDKNGLVRSTFRNLTSEVSAGSLKWKVPEGNWRLMFFMQRDSPPSEGPGTAGEVSPCCPDLMNPAAVDKFISVTHGEYYRRFPEYFGTTITGIFTDEPGFLNNRIDGVFPNTVPWTEALPAFFERKKGYSLVDSLPLVWVGESEANAKVRTDFWDALSTLYMETYFGKIQDWCQAHKIESIGHVLEDTLRFHRTFEGGDYFKTMRYMSRGGVDQIGSRNFGLINPKLASSAAVLFGLPHALSETFGAYGWGLTLEQMKAIINMHAASGIDTEILHAFFYSIEGQRKQDSPADLFYHQLWRDQFHGFVEDASRTLYLADRGRQVTDVAIFYPATAIMTEGGLMNFVPLAKMEEYFLSASVAIRGGQHDFNYVDELALAGNRDLKVPVSRSGTGLNVNGHTYSVIVLPAVPAISGAAASTLEKFYQSGGKIIALGVLPARATDGQSRLVHSFLRSVFGTEEAIPTQRIALRNQSAGRAIFVPIPNMVSDEELAKISPMALATAPTSIHRGHELDFSQPWVQQLLEAVSQTARSDMRIVLLHPSIAFLHKRGGGKDWYLLSNDSEKSVSDDFTFSSSGAPSLWDPETGTIREAPVFRLDSGRTTISLKLLPYSAVAVVFNSEKSAEARPHLTRSDGEVLGSEAAGNRLKIKVLTEAAGPVSVTATDGSHLLTHSFVQPDSLRPVPIEGQWQFSFLRLPGANTAVASRTTGSWTNDWPDFSGTAWYEKEIVVDREWLGVGRKVYLDLGEVNNIASVRVNGKNAGTELWSPYRLEVTDLLKAGSNHLEVGVTNTLANRYGQGRPGLVEKPASGLLGPVRLIPAKVLEYEFSWK
jgi:hypothetical protein